MSRAARATARSSSDRASRQSISSLVEVARRLARSSSVRPRRAVVPAGGWEHVRQASPGRARTRSPGVGARPRRRPGRAQRTPAPAIEAEYRTARTAWAVFPRCSILRPLPTVVRARPVRARARVADVEPAGVGERAWGVATRPKGMACSQRPAWLRRCHGRASVTRHIVTRPVASDHLHRAPGARAECTAAARIAR